MIALVLAGVALAAPAAWAPAPAARPAYTQAREALSAGQFDDAAREFDRSLRQDRSCGACGAGLAVALAARRAPEALPLARDVALSFPKEPEAHAAVWVAAVVAGDAAQARAAAEAGVALAPADPLAWQRLADAHALAGTWADGLAAVANAPSAACLQAQLHAGAGRTAEAEAARAACSGDPELVRRALVAVEFALEAQAGGQRAASPAALRYERARERLASGDLAGAEADLAEVIALRPEVVVRPDGVLLGATRATDVAAHEVLVRAAGALLAELRAARGDLAGAAAALPPGRARNAGEAVAAARIGMARSDWTGAWAALAPWTAAEPARIEPIAADLFARAPAAAPPWAEPMLWASTSPEARQRLATGLLARGDAAGCLRAEPDARLAHTCAVAAGDLDAADRHASRAGELDPSAALGHAIALREAGRPAAAAVMLGRVRDLPDSARPVRDALLVLLHADLGDAAAAVEMASRGQVAPEALVEAAGTLHAGGAVAEAKQLLELACPRLTGDARKRCDANRRL